MKKHTSKIVSILIIIIAIISMGLTTYGHSGRTDANGGHRDNKNQSGLGNYHYHCGGHPAHLHKNGVCPYSSKSSSSKKKKSSSKSSTTKKSTKTTSSNTNKPKTTNVNVKAIKINEEIEEIEVGDSQILTVEVTPDNATNKNVEWASSDEDIAEVTSSGKVIAKKTGLVNITATSNNGKKSTIQLSVKEDEKLEPTPIMTTTLTNANNTTSNNTINNTSVDNPEDTNPLGTIIGLGILCGGGYLGYKKYKKSK